MFADNLYCNLVTVSAVWWSSIFAVLLASHHPDDRIIQVVGVA